MKTQKEKVLVKTVTESVAQLRRAAKAYHKALEKAERSESKLYDFVGGDGTARLDAMLKKIEREIEDIKNPTYDGDGACL